MNNPQTPTKKSPLGASAFIAGQTVQVEVPFEGKTITLNVRELGYAEKQSLYAQSNIAKSVNPFAHLVAAAVSDAEGNTFTVDEVNRLKQEVAEPLFKQVLKFQGIDIDEKSAEGDEDAGELAAAPK